MNLNLTDEQKDIRNAAREFAEKEFPDIAVQCDSNEEYPFELWKKACDLGFIGLSIPETFGGAGLGLLEHAFVMEEFSRVDAGCSSILLAAEGAALIQEYGTEEQKKRYLPPLLAGKNIIGCAIGPDGKGTAADRFSAHAEQDGLGYIINGTKNCIANATIAENIVVSCCIKPGDEHGNRFFMIETTAPGCKITRMQNKFGRRAADIAHVQFNNVRVPQENLIGGKEGKPGNQPMQFENRTRVVSAAHNVGIAQGAMEKAIYYARSRKAFGSPIGLFHAIQIKLGEMATFIEAARKLYYSAAWMYDQGKPDSKRAAAAGWFASKVDLTVVDQALQIHGGYGYIKESDIERIYRDGTVAATLSGTNDMEKMSVAHHLLGL